VKVVPEMGRAYRVECLHFINMWDETSARRLLIHENITFPIESVFEICSSYVMYMQL